MPPPVAPASWWDLKAALAAAFRSSKRLKESLAANRILSIYGIINGTSNYILTKMTEEGTAV